MSATVITIVILIILFVATLIFAICQRKLSDELKIQLRNKTDAYIHLQEEFELYRKSESFKHQKEDEANEKINDLRTGKLSADDILPKR
jgi:predicted Holliday junction resolvase-like endonuclease